MNSLTRRKVLAAPLALAGSAVANPYFCRSIPPPSQRLVHANGGDPSSLDAGQLTGSNGDQVVAALLDSLTSLHTTIDQPAAGLATHFLIENGGTRYTFYPRGHASPRGKMLPNSDSLPDEFTGGRTAPPNRIPAWWSDGSPVTAHDFVYAWRRLLDPTNGGSLGFYLGAIQNGNEVLKGGRGPEGLAVRAVSDFAFQFDLTAHFPLILKLRWQPFLAAVPRHAVEAARHSGDAASWMAPGSYNRIVLAKNPSYRDADIVRLNELIVLRIPDENTNLHLYRPGETQSMHPYRVPPAFTAEHEEKKEFHTATAYLLSCYDFQVKHHPFDGPAARYAMSLATDRRAIASPLGKNQRPATGIVPPIPGCPTRDCLFVTINGRRLDVPGFNPRTARERLAQEGLERLSIEITLPIRTGSREVARIVQAQWREQMGASLRLREQEENTWAESAIRNNHRHVIEDSWTPFYEDSDDFLVEFGSDHYVDTTWIEKTFDGALDAANRITDTQQRVSALFSCEEQILRAMLAHSVTFERWAYFEAPYLRGVRPNPFGALHFKYSRIDHHWRRQA